MTLNFQPLYTDISGKKANLTLLILSSQGIKAHSQKNKNRFDILVDARDLAKARVSIETYKQENLFFRRHHLPEPGSASSFFSITAMIIMAVMCAIHFAGSYYQLHDHWVLIYGASALYILQGETHRAITALFLHGDVQHLLGNLAGILIFAAPLIRMTGYGTGVFILLFSGTAGNLVNAHFHQSIHLSIGASTLVMSAAGLLCAARIMQPGQPFRIKSLLPVFSGALLMALFSQGENTDVWAHIFGFIFGLLSGCVFFPLNRMWQFPGKQATALTITVIILIIAGAAPFFHMQI